MPDTTIAAAPPDPYAALPDPSQAAVQPQQGAPPTAQPQAGDPYAALSDPSQGATQPSDQTTTTSTDNTGQLPSISDAVHSYIQGVRERVGSNPTEFGHNVVARLTGLAQGANLNISRTALTIEKLARDIDKAHGIYPNGHPLDADIAGAEALMNREADKRAAMTPTQRGYVNVGDDMTNIMQYMGGEAIMKGLPITDMIEQLGPVKAALQKVPLAAKVLRQMIEQGITGGAQSLGQGDETPDVLKSSLLSAGVGSLGELSEAR